MIHSHPCIRRVSASCHPSELQWNLDIMNLYVAKSSVLVISELRRELELQI